MEFSPYSNTDSSVPDFASRRCPTGGRSASHGWFNCYAPHPAQQLWFLQCIAVFLKKIIFSKRAQSITLLIEIFNKKKDEQPNVHMKQSSITPT